MFTWIDDKLLGAAQKFCDKFQRLTGYTKFKLQKWALILHVVFLSGVLVTHRDGVTIVLFGIIVVGTISAISIFEVEEKIFLATGVPMRSTFGSARLVCLFPQGFVWLIHAFMPVECSPPFLLGLPFLPVATYFAACVPRPPSKSKAREWYERGLTWLNDQLKPEPIPAPN